MPAKTVVKEKSPASLLPLGPAPPPGMDEALLLSGRWVEHLPPPPGEPPALGAIPPLYPAGPTEFSYIVAQLTALEAGGIVQQPATTDLRQVLININALATGGATPLNTNGGVLTVDGAGSGLVVLRSTATLSGVLIEAADTGNNTVAFPLEVRHTCSTGTGAPNIGAGIFFSSESDTEGQFNSLASISGIALVNTFGAQTGRLRVRAAIAGTNTDLAYFDGSVGTQIALNAGAKLGFFGVTPVVKQVGASAAGIAGITDAAAKAAITALQNAMAAYGIVTAPA